MVTDRIADTDPTLGTAPPVDVKAGSLFKLCWGDYLALCKWKGAPESDRRRALLALPRLFVNPSLHAALALRLANASPRWTWWIWRNFFIRMHSMDWSGPLDIEPGIYFPHPFGICLTHGARIGKDVVIGHNCTLAGSAEEKCPVLGDGVVIFPGVMIKGGVEIGEGSAVSANCVVTRNVPPHKVVTPNGVIPIAAASELRAMHPQKAA